MAEGTVRLVLITGLSGAGKSEAIHCFEDLGYFCVDNLPPALIPKFAELCAQSGGAINRVALVCDIRGGGFFDNLFEALGDLEKTGFHFEILFLEASDEALVRRFKETRRRHPLAPEGGILEGIKEERRKLEHLRIRADIIIDTSSLSSRELKEEIIRTLLQEHQSYRIAVTVISFGFKHGIPMDADLVFDVRFLPNPHYIPTLEPFTGNDEPVIEYVFQWPVTKKFMAKLTDFVEFLLPQYIQEGKTQLIIGIGCTGGKHRSVAISNALAQFVRTRGYRVAVEHRDCRLARAEPVG